MNKFSIWALALSFPLFFACKGESTSDNQAPMAAACSYSYDASSTTLEWTAFKFTERAGVKGTFDHISIDGINEAESAEGLLNSLNFSIHTVSVNSDKPERDEKINKHFFETLNTPYIEGKVVSVDLVKNTASVSIRMNNIEKTVSGEALLKDDVFSFHTMIDVNDWKGQKAVQALNTVCDSLHTGPDGISKLWSEVELSFTTKLSVTCK